MPTEPKLGDTEPKLTDLAERKTEHVQLSPTDLLTAIAQAVVNPQMDVEKMERLLAMHERITAEQRRTAFQAAMARLAPKLPEVGKHGESHHGKYARLEDIDRAIRPLLSEEGLSMSFDSFEIPGEKVRVVCKLAHSEGHFESKEITLPIDKSGSKNGAQAVISTVAYGRRALTKMFFNLIEKGEDTDGNNPEPITPAQVAEIEKAIEELKMNRSKFLMYMAAGDVPEILAKDWKKAQNAIDTQRHALENQKKKGPQI